MPPIGIANNSQGNIISAPTAEIRNGSLVRVVASRGAEVLSRPSATLLAALADQSFLNSGPSFCGSESDIYSTYFLRATIGTPK
jgi:hypothetical protein